MYAITIADTEDASAIAVLGANVWVQTYATAGVSEAIAKFVLTTFTPEKILSLLKDPNAVLLVAKTAGNLAGYMVIRFESPHADVSTEVETLYVQDAFSGRGLGSALLAHAGDIVEARAGSRAVWLTVNSQNERAIAFYHARGMVQEGVSYFELGGIKHENKVMVLRS